MAQATATWTDTVNTDWEPADLIHTDNIIEQVLQNIEHVAQTHGHDADTDDDGGRLKAKEPKDILFFS